MHIVIGNGESRKKIDLKKFDNHCTYGCNAFYRDYNPSTLVSQDYKIIHEIVKSGYAKNNLCYFNYDVLIDGFLDEIMLPEFVKQGYGLIQNTKTDYKFFIGGQEKTKVFYDENKTQEMVDSKLIYVNYINSDDKIETIKNLDIEEPMDTGMVATNLMAILENPKKIYLLGFDFNNNNGLVNNVYKDTECYAPSYCLPVMADGWISDMNYLIDKHNNIDFVHVQDTRVLDGAHTISVREFEELL